jgi:hypothetical protein
MCQTDRQKLKNATPSYCLVTKLHRTTLLNIYFLMKGFGPNDSLNNTFMIRMRPEKVLHDNKLCVIILQLKNY